MDMTILIFIGASVLALILAVVGFIGSRKQATPEQVERLNIAFDEYVKNRLFTDAFVQEVHGKIYQEIEKYLSKVFIDFEHDLESVIGNVSQQLHASTSEKLTKELDAYRDTVQESTEYIRNMVGELETAYKEASQRVETKLQEFSDTEKERITALIDRRFEDIIDSYLKTIMENQVDLGAQRPYIFKQLEQHKEEIKKDVNEGI